MRIMYMQMRCSVRIYLCASAILSRSLASHGSHESHHSPPTGLLEMRVYVLIKKGVLIRAITTDGPQRSLSRRTNIDGA